MNLVLKNILLIQNTKLAFTDNRPSIYKSVSCLRKILIFPFIKQMTSSNSNINYYSTIIITTSKGVRLSEKLQHSVMKFDRSNKFDLCCHGQVNSLLLKSSLASKWTRKDTLFGSINFACIHYSILGLIICMSEVNIQMLISQTYVCSPYQVTL